MVGVNALVYSPSGWVQSNCSPFSWQMNPTSGQDSEQILPALASFPGAAILYTSYIVNDPDALRQAGKTADQALKEYRIENGVFNNICE